MAQQRVIVASVRRTFNFSTGTVRTLVTFRLTHAHTVRRGYSYAPVPLRMLACRRSAVAGWLLPLRAKAPLARIQPRDAGVHRSALHERRAPSGRPGWGVDVSAGVPARRLRSIGRGRPSMRSLVRPNDVLTDRHGERSVGRSHGWAAFQPGLLNGLNQNLLVSACPEFAQCEYCKSSKQNTV